MSILCLRIFYGVPAMSAADECIMHISVFGETWSSKFASALFDHAQMEEIASIPEFNIPDDEFPISFISSGLKTVAENMRVSTYCSCVL